MTSDEIREAFLKFFEVRGHQRVPSSSLIPQADPTLLFVNAGMVQFKDVFLGNERRAYSRATTSQKCVRAGGKHNDLDSVGRTARHHTFFEMLGNFSFGDYFKADAIDYAWTFLTEVASLPKERLWITIYTDDDEADRLWRERAGIPADRIIRLGEKDNFWSMGDTGPCGPCSEIHYDRGPDFACGSNCGIGKCDCDRWLEIWNLVFMQFNRDASGAMTPLPKPSIDTGMGLERIASILQGQPDNWGTDLLRPLLERVAELSGVPYQPGEPGFPHRVIADHARACTFLIADGVLPGNEGRGYVLRRILRRAIRFGRKLGMEQPFMGAMAEAVGARMVDAYPDLNTKIAFVKRVLQLEEERFSETLSTGMNILQEQINALQRTGAESQVPGAAAFRLYDTYGFPYELTEEIAAEQGLSVDRVGFEAEMAAQRERARAARRASGAAAKADYLDYSQLPLPETEFLGYQTVLAPARLVSVATPAGATEETTEGAEVEVVLDRTPFYAEGGGQVGDLGTLVTETGLVEVTDTVKAGHGLVVHKGRVARGMVAVDQHVDATVDASRRADIARNHTATHLLHAALRQVLGPHVQQAGSLVAPDRLRFDFSHIGAMTPDEVAETQRLANERIREDWNVRPRESSYQDAIKEGALAFFDEKYGERVRVVEVRRPENGRPHLHAIAADLEVFSKELCGGTHCASTGEIGFVHIVSESSIGAGVRRIEAVTGRAAEEVVRQRLGALDELSRQVGAPPHEVAARVQGLMETLEQERRRTQALERELQRHSVQEILSQAHEVAGVPVIAARVAATSMDALREMSDLLRERQSGGVIVLGAVFGDRPNFLAIVAKELVGRGVNAGALVKEVAAITGGSGGGRPEMAQAGGRDTGRLDEALQRVPQLLQQQLGA